MKSQGGAKLSKTPEVGASRIQSHSDGASRDQTPSCEEIRFRAYEIYFERGSLPRNALDDWMQAERELHGRAPQESESTEIEGHKP